MPWKISGCVPALIIFASYMLECSEYVCLGNCSLTLCYMLQWSHAMYCIWHIQNCAIFRTLFFQVYTGIFKHTKRYWGIFTHIETLLRHIQTYSLPCVTLASLQAYHILSPGKFRTWGLFITLWNVDQPYSEPCHRALFRYIQNLVQRFYT